MAFNLQEAATPIINGLICRVLRPGTIGDNFLNGAYDFSGNRVPNPRGDIARAEARAVLNCPVDIPADGNYKPDGVDASGQCVAKYTVSFDYSYTDQGGNRQSSTALGGNIQGPLGAVGYETYFGPFASGFRGYVDAAGGRVYFGERGGYGYDDVEISNIQKNRDDGLPDNCGTTDSRPRYEGPITVVDGNGNTTTYNTTIILDNPRFGRNGGLTIPFGVLAPTGFVSGRANLGVNPTIELNPEFNPEFEGAEPVEGEPPDTDFPPPPEDPDDPPDPEDDRCLVGVIVYTKKLTPLKQTGELGNGETFPRLYQPKSGQLCFAVRVGDRRTWSEPYKLQAHTQWVPWSHEGCAYYAAIRPEVGFTHELEYVYIAPAETEE